MQETETYITIKNHKDKYPNKTPSRLINPSKSSMGKIIKAILDTINKNLQKTTNGKIHLMYLTGIQTPPIKRKLRLSNVTLKVFIPQ